MREHRAAHASYATGSGMQTSCSSSDPWRMNRLLDRKSARFGCGDGHMQGGASEVRKVFWNREPFKLQAR